MFNQSFAPSRKDSKISNDHSSVKYPDVNLHKEFSFTPAYSPSLHQTPKLPDQTHLQQRRDQSPFSYISFTGKKNIEDERRAKGQLTEMIGKIHVQGDTDSDVSFCIKDPQFQQRDSKTVLHKDRVKEVKHLIRKSDLFESSMAVVFGIQPQTQIQILNSTILKDYLKVKDFEATVFNSQANWMIIVMNEDAPMGTTNLEKLLQLNGRIMKRFQEQMIGVESMNKTNVFLMMESDPDQLSVVFKDEINQLEQSTPIIGKLKDIELELQEVKEIERPPAWGVDLAIPKQSYLKRMLENLSFYI